MEIKELKIAGYKSLADITLVNPNAFSVFVGANAAGKSNIFEALQFFNYCNNVRAYEVIKMFGGIEDIHNFSNFIHNLHNIKIVVELIQATPNVTLFTNDKLNTWGVSILEWGLSQQKIAKEDLEKWLTFEDLQHLANFTRIFVGNKNISKTSNTDDSKLAADASNLERVLKRILKDEGTRNEIIEILQLLIPGIDKVEIATEPLSGSDNLLIYENNFQKPLPKRLISDGTYNIIAIITAIFQSDTPQFLCIEEPENGLNPKVLKVLVNIIREKCKEKGHFIWLNTHSQSIVAELTVDEIILVDKKGGNTHIKQIQGLELNGLRMDEALLTNALGGGIAW